jgi:hypothetical protein
MPSDLNQLFGSLRRDTAFVRLAAAEELRHIQVRRRALRSAVAAGFAVIAITGLVAAGLSARAGGPTGIVVPGDISRPSPSFTSPSPAERPSPSATPSPTGPLPCTATDFAGTATEMDDDASGGYHGRIISVVNRGPAACTVSNPPKVHNKTVTFPPGTEPGADPAPAVVVVPAGKTVAFALFLRTRGAGAPPDPSCKKQTYRDLSVDLGDGSVLRLPVTVVLPCQGAVAVPWTLGS